MTPEEQYRDLEEQRAWWEQHIAYINANKNYDEDVKAEDIARAEDSIRRIDEEMEKLYPKIGGVQ